MKFVKYLKKILRKSAILCYFSRSYLSRLIYFLEYLPEKIASSKILKGSEILFIRYFPKFFLFWEYCL